MDDELVDIVLGDDTLDDYILGKTKLGFFEKIILWTALVLFISIIGSIFADYLIENIRLQIITQEVNEISELAYSEAVTSFQNINISDYMYQGNTNTLTDSYRQYLNELSSVGYSMGSTELLSVVNYLSHGTNGGRSKYTPLSFGLSFLDVDIIRNNFNELLQKQSNILNSETTNSTVFNSILLGEDKFRLIDTNVRLKDLSIYDISDINVFQSGLSNSENERRKMLFRKLYGTDNSKVISNLTTNITGKKFIVVYDLEFTVKYRPFFNTSWFRKVEGRDFNWRTNKYGYYAYPDIVYTFNKVYCISN